MEQIFTEKAMREAEAFTMEQLGISDLVLMERAALAVAEEAEKLLEQPQRDPVLVVCGTGNNGGDGYAAARILSERGIPTVVLSVGYEASRSRACRVQYLICRNCSIPIVHQFEDRPYALIIDALFGIGLSREIRGVYAEVIDKINRSSAKKVAVDLPSGVCADTGQILGIAVKADVTVTFEKRKVGQLLFPGAECCGTVICRSVGIWTENSSRGDSLVFACHAEDLPKMLPKRSANANKGTCGKVLLIAGSDGMSGAACLCARAAYRSGSGLVRVFTPASNQSVTAGVVPEALVTAWETENMMQKLEEALEWASVCGIGPGLGTSEEAKEILRYVLEHWRKPLVLDADALNLLAADPELLALASERNAAATVVTPHLGEMARLTGISVAEIQKNPPAVCRSFAAAHHLICVQKDARTVISDGTRTFLNLTGNDGMATGGSGDVLTGILCALLGQNTSEDALSVIAAGVCLHGLAGDEAARKYSRYSVMASDLAEGISAVLCKENEKRI